MYEVITNLHMHTRYSDGHANHSEIAQAALRAGVDVVIVTDHNVWVQGKESYHMEGDRRVLLLVGEEIHDQARQPQKSHLLVFGAGRELAHMAWDPQRLVDAVRNAGGIAFLAHPVDPAAPAVKEDNLSWADWQVRGYQGLELWNAMSEFKSLIRTRLHALWYAFNPEQIARGPFPEVLARWDELLKSGRRVAVIGGTDAHAMPARMGPVRKVIFPYDFHFRTVNTHLLLPGPLTGKIGEDRRAIYQALGRGCGFIGYDLPAPTRGFRFTAQGKERTACMGEEVSSKGGVTLQVRMPRPTLCHLLKDGKVVKEWSQRETAAYITTEPGVYRVEAFIPYKGRQRGWIYSNPIYVVK